MNTKAMQAYNPNYIGGDINGGKQDITQLFTRPAGLFDPYHIPETNMYICSSSTPPGGGVHGMCGFHAAESALKKEFRTPKWI
jgi:phytoene dehydrogenase-like protein